MLFEVALLRVALEADLALKRLLLRMRQLVLLQAAHARTILTTLTTFVPSPTLATHHVFLDIVFHVQLLVTQRALVHLPVIQVALDVLLHDGATGEGLAAVTTFVGPVGVVLELVLVTRVMHGEVHFEVVGLHVRLAARAALVGPRLGRLGLGQVLHVGDHVLPHQSLVLEQDAADDAVDWLLLLLRVLLRRRGCFHCFLSAVTVNGVWSVMHSAPDQTGLQWSVLSSSCNIVSLCAPNFVTL